MLESSSRPPIRSRLPVYYVESWQPTGLVAVSLRVFGNRPCMASIHWSLLIPPWYAQKQCYSEFVNSVGSRHTLAHRSKRGSSLPTKQQKTWFTYHIVKLRVKITVFGVIIYFTKWSDWLGLSDYGVGTWAFRCLW